MGRRTSISLKMVLPLPGLSWVALLRLLKKAPLGFMGVDAASKAFLGCGAVPDAPSFRYTAALLPPMRHRSGRWRKPALLPGCASRPPTDSFRIHHVVNQEALQRVLSFEDDLGTDDTFYAEEPQPDCSVIRDGDRLLHDRDGASASVMSACSSRFSHSTAGSLFSAATTAFSRGSEDSEEPHYSTASATSFRAGSCCSSPLSYCHTSGPAAADSDRLSESANAGAVATFDQPVRPDSREVSIIFPFGQQNAGCSRHDDMDAYPTLPHGNSSHHGHHGDDGDIHDVDEDGMGIVAETYMSKDPLLDFETSVEEVVSCHQLIGQPDRLHTLYCRYIQLNPPCLHPTIALAFFLTVQRLGRIPLVT